MLAESFCCRSATRTVTAGHEPWCVVEAFHRLRMATATFLVRLFQTNELVQDLSTRRCVPVSSCIATICPLLLSCMFLLPWSWARPVVVRCKPTKGFDNYSKGGKGSQEHSIIQLTEENTRENGSPIPASSGDSELL